jgi:hypothetical protein
VCVGVRVGVAVGVRVGVRVGVAVGVAVGLSVGVLVGVRVGVAGIGAFPAQPPPQVSLMAKSGIVQLNGACWQKLRHAPKSNGSWQTGLGVTAQPLQKQQPINAVGVKVGAWVGVRVGVCVGVRVIGG